MYHGTSAHDLRRQDIRDQFDAADAAATAASAAGGQSLSNPNPSSNAGKQQ